MSFLQSKKPPFEKTTPTNEKTNASVTEKKGSKDISKFWPESWVNSLSKYANLSTIEKCYFYGLKSLLLTKQHNEATKPRSLELMTIIMGYPLFKRCKFFNNSKISFVGAKKPLFEKISSPNDKTISLLQKSRLKRYLKLMTRIMG